jgi:cysteine synthase B
LSTQWKAEARLVAGPSVGGTPLMRLGSRHVMAKIEWMNPSGSVKDRAASWMVKEALEARLVEKGRVIIEPSSGNMGIALAAAAKVSGLGVEIVVPEKASEETKELLRRMGATVLQTTDDLCPRVGKGTDQCIALAKSFSASKPEMYYMPNQYENMANFRAHYGTTGPEIWRDTAGGVDVFVAGVGTGGTITGVAKYLKEKGKVRVVAVQPQPNHKIQGLRNVKESAMPEVLKKGLSLIDEWVTVSNDEAFEGARLLASEFEVFAGPSSGAVYAATRKLGIGAGERAVIVFGDSGLKYRSVYRENGVFTDAEMAKLMAGGSFNELLDNSLSPAARMTRGEL